MNQSGNVNMCPRCQRAELPCFCYGSQYALPTGQAKTPSWNNLYAPSVVCETCRTHIPPGWTHTCYPKVAELKAKLAEAEAERDRLAKENEGLRAKLEKHEEIWAALGLIAAPARADGTYNRSREACEQLAVQALAALHASDPKGAV